MVRSMQPNKLWTSGSSDQRQRSVQREVTVCAAQRCLHHHDAIAAKRHGWRGLFPTDRDQRLCQPHLFHQLRYAADESVHRFSDRDD